MFDNTIAIHLDRAEEPVTMKVPDAAHQAHPGVDKELEWQR